jgi:hypothetical protein
MRIAVVLAKDEAGKQYVLNGKQAIELETVEVGAVKEAFDNAVDNGFSLGGAKGAKKSALVAGVILTNNGLIKRRRFKV